MASDGEKLNSFDENNKLWQDFSDYKKALWLSKNEVDCRFILNSQNENQKIFPAHMWILKCASTKFESLFSENVKDANLNDIEPKAFKKFLDYIYYGDTENLMAADAVTLKNLITLGKAYQMNSINEICIGVMKQNLEKSENYDLIGIFEYACLLEDDELINECKKVIVGRATSKIKFNDFNFNKPEEKRHLNHIKNSLGPLASKTESAGPSSSSNGISEANKTIQTNSINNGSTAFASNGNNSFNFGAPSLAPVFPICAFGSKDNSSNVSKPNIFGASTSAQTNTEQSTSFSQNSAKASIPEAKIQNIESNIKETGNIFGNSLMPTGISKGDITKCSYIYQLNPSVFYEFQNTLNGHIPEHVRFNMIETYAKISGLNNSKIDKKSSEKNNNNSNDESSPDFQQQQMMTASSKQILNMMLRSIKFHRMTAKEFTAGPGKSSLLDIAEKYDLLAGIVNKN